MDKLIVASVLVSFAVLAFFYLAPFERGSDGKIALCEGEPSEIDLQMLERYSEIVTLFTHHADDIWNADYRLDQVPLFVVHGQPGQTATHGYIFNHPDIQSVENVCIMPQTHDNVPEVYKQTKISKDNPINTPIYNFDYELGGASTMLMSYVPDMAFFNPELFDWLLITTHETFHQYQMHHWDWLQFGIIPSLDFFPVDVELIALTLLEQELIKSAFTTSDNDIRDASLKQLYAVRAARLEAHPELIDTNKEHTEGAALYIEFRIVDITGREPVNFSRSNIVERLSLLSQDFMIRSARQVLSFNRLYGTGSALALIFDDMGMGSDWQLAVDQGKTFMDHIQEHYTISEDELSGLIDAAKAVHDYEALRFWAEGLEDLILAEPPPTSTPTELPMPYELPAEPSDISLSLDQEALPEDLSVAGTYIINAEDIDPAEVFLYSTEGEAVEVVVLGNEENETRIHISPTSHPSLEAWFENEMKQSQRIPVVGLREFEGVQYGITYSGNSSFISANSTLIFVMDGALVHIFGRAPLEDKLAVSRLLLGMGDS